MTWEGDRAERDSAPSLSGLQLETMLTDKFSSSTAARLRNRLATTEMTDRLDVSMPAIQRRPIKNSRLSGAFGVSAGHSWRNDIRRGLKILGRATSVRVRVPPPGIPPEESRAGLCDDAGVARHIQHPRDR